MKLHSDWCAAGYDPDAFWRQTPRTFVSAMRGARERFRIEGERDLALAHTTAAFTRAERLEPLATYLAPAKPRTMLDKLQAMADRFGGSVTIQ